METYITIFSIVVITWLVGVTISVFHAHAMAAQMDTRLLNAAKRVEAPTSKLSIRDSCEHSWHPLVNEQQDDQRIVIIECVKCGSISKDIIGRCNHEWEETDNVLAASKYEIAIEPIKELLKRMSSSSAKYDKAMKQIMDKWITDDNVEDSNFERKSVRVKTCKRCGDIFVLDFSNSHLSARVMSREQQLLTHVQDSTS